MSTDNKKTLAGTVGIGKLLFSSIASAGKTELGVTSLNLDMTPASNVKLCFSETDVAQLSTGKVSPNNVTVEIDPFSTANVQMNFTVGDLLPGNQDYVVFLAYSPNKTKSPPILTPRSDNKLLLDLNGLEILGSYSFPKTTEFSQAMTRVGQAQSKARQKLLFTVNLSTDSIPTLIRAGVNRIYLQALIVGSNDFERGSWDSALLSSVNTIDFSKACAATDAVIKADSTGSKTSKPAGINNTTISKSSTSSTTSKTTTNTSTNTNTSTSTCTSGKSC